VEIDDKNVNKRVNNFISWSYHLA